MSTVCTKTCDRCGKQPINEDYTLSVGVVEHPPQRGGIITDHELNEKFDFCLKCKQEIIDQLLPLLRERTSS